MKTTSPSSLRDTPSSPRRIGILGFDGVADLAFIGPLQAFSNAAHTSGENESASCYEVVSIALRGTSFATESGVILHAAETVETAAGLDTIIVPGGKGLLRPEVAAAVARWIIARSAETRRIAAVCTGIYGLAPTGLLDQRRVTTHWRFCADLALRFPQLRVEENALFLQDGKFYTSGGGTAAIDLSLAMIAQDFGEAVALTVARDLLVYPQRDGGQEQYAEPAPPQIGVDGSLAELARWIDEHLGEDLRLEHLAKRAGLARVHFIRKFKAAFGLTPGAFIKNRRLNEARRRLLAGEPAERVASAVGFHSALYFAQEFKWRFGSGPEDYQARFRFASAGAAPNVGAAAVRSGQSLRQHGERWTHRVRRGSTADERKRVATNLALEAA